MIHVPGSYVHDEYHANSPSTDPPGHALGWNTTAGWYTGPDSRTRQWRSDHPGEASVGQLPNLGAGQQFLGLI